MTGLPPAGRPRIGITLGDPAGIGPEVVLKALQAPPKEEAGLTVFGSASALADCARRIGLSLPEGVALLDVPLSGPLDLGRPTAVGGRAAAEAVLAAVDAWRRDEVDGIVTAPLNKTALRAAGYPWPGHTELFSEALGANDTAMAFLGGGLRVALITIHRPLRSVADALTRTEVCRVVRLLDRELPGLGAPGRRIGLCGLNPHAGETGLLGREEIEVLSPAVAELRAEGLDVSGPFPSDSLFVRAVRGEFDAVVANYHDQGLIPVKLLAFGRAVNVTLGLPLVRTSVDHGTGFDIVLAGTADCGSLKEAIDTAVVLVRRRNRTRGGAPPEGRRGEGASVPGSERPGGLRVPGPSS